MLFETCQECDRLWREYSELAHRSFRLEETLRHAERLQDHDQVKAVAARLAHLAGEQTQLPSVDNAQAGLGVINA